MTDGKLLVVSSRTKLKRVGHGHTHGQTSSADWSRRVHDGVLPCFVRRDKDAARRKLLTLFRHEEGHTESDDQLHRAISRSYVATDDRSKATAKPEPVRFSTGANRYDLRPTLQWRSAFTVRAFLHHNHQHHQPSSLHFGN
jgi:hypothetical protein